MKITVVLLSFKRTQNIPFIINSIKDQDIETNLILWNNNPDINFKKSDSFARVDHLINSEENLYCNIRWEIAKKADTEFVLIIDDDLCFNDNTVLRHLLSESIANYEKGRLFGVEGVILDENLTYFDVSKKEKTFLHKEIPEDADFPIHFAQPHENLKVDIVKGRLILFKKDDLSATANVPTQYIDKADDITYSLWMGDKKRNHLLIGGCSGRMKDFENKNDSNSLSSVADWKTYRNDAVKYMVEMKAQQIKSELVIAD